MANVALVGLVDGRGWLLLQERDDRAPVDPDRWCLVGGQVEPGESALAAAHRELVEETGLVVEELLPVGSLTLPCDLHGEDLVSCFTAPTGATDADVRCGEGRQIVFVAPDEVAELDLTRSTRAFAERVLAAHAT
jgi:8-oxo-dGTP diphosphatase